MPGRYERVCVGWHCAKVKGHAELQIEKSRVKTFIYDFPKLHHSSPNSFGANVHLRQFFVKTVKVIERSKQGQNYRRGAQGTPVHQICCNSDHYFRSYGILKKMAHAIFFRSAAILNVLVRPNWFLTCPSKRKPTFWSNSGYFSSVIVVITRVGTFVSGKRSKFKWIYK